jgi:hypothetical protein
VILSMVGFLLLIGGILNWVFSSVVTFEDTTLIIGGVVLLVVGIFVYVADLIETFLSRGQTALVDGLQAG